VRQTYQRLAEPPFDRPTTARATVREWLGVLERDGICKVDRLIAPDRLARLRREVGRSFAWLDGARRFGLKRFRHYDARAYWHPRHRSFVDNDPVAGSDAALDLCCDERVVETAAYYLGKPAHLKRVTAMRYLPSELQDQSQFGWHHDMEDRQIKLMVLLTDIGTHDQYMVYARGTARALRPYRNYLRNGLEVDMGERADSPGIAKTIGTAGDGFFFDSNGAHRGIRSLGAVRDALFVEFTADRNLGNYWGTERDRRGIAPGLTTNDSPLARFFAVEPKWRRAQREAPRTRPTWAETLTRPETWL
jgi:hypothetical protein